MGDYATARCHLLLGNPTTNIEYIGATMDDNLQRYEALAGAVENIDFDGALFQKCANAITELVAMVREAREDRDGFMEQLDNAALEREELDEARDLTWFWQIVDRNGLADVCSDERSALAELARAHRELAELKRKSMERSMKHRTWMKLIVWALALTTIVVFLSGCAELRALGHACKQGLCR